MNNICAFRKKIPIGQGEFARSINMLPSTLANYESGARGVRVEIAWRIVGGLQRELRGRNVPCRFEDVFPPTSDIEKAAA